MQEKLPKRKKIRLQEYDYSQENMYFITICVKDRREILGNIIDDHIKLSKEGEIIKNKGKVTISKIIKHFKTNITKEIKETILQKSFYEHIIRDEKEYLKIKEYIKNNAMSWKEDKYF